MDKNKRGKGEGRARTAPLCLLCIEIVVPQKAIISSHFCGAELFIVLLGDRLLSPYRLYAKPHRKSGYTHEGRGRRGPTDLAA